MKLRKAITTVVVGCAVAAGASGIATAASPHVAGKRCGTKYTPTCVAPHIKTPPVSAKCVDTGSTYKLPKVTFTSNAGIRRIQVREGARTVKQVSFSGRGPTQYSLRGLRVPTVSLGVGGHVITIRVTDIRGRTASKTLRFSVCVATPVFTG